MVTSLKEQSLKRQPIYRNIHITQIVSYRLPPTGWVSILHRVTGAAMFLALPFAIWMFDSSLGSEGSYEQFVDVFRNGVFGLPGWFIRLATFGLLWAYLFHFCAGLRHLWMDATHSVGLQFGRISAIVVMALSTIIAFALGAKLFLSFPIF